MMELKKESTRQAMPGEVLLGFEVPTGEPVYIRPTHLAIFGMTQLSGKTTTLEALISRSGLRGVAFITKRGEKGFTTYLSIPPYYKERVDWRYVESLLNTALGEKVKYEPRMRWCIMQVSKGAKTLREVRDRAVKRQEESKKDWDKEVYGKLVAYLDLVLPELEKHKFADKVELSNGVNVMDLSDMRLETQQLIIASTIDYIYHNEENVVVIVPEAWEQLPQSRMTPVKWTAEQFIRKGAAINNYMWIDSQDIGGIDKTPLRQVSTWIMGRMMEAHEVERIVKQLLGVRISGREIQTLPLGHFFVTVGDQVKKVYVLPAGIPEAFGEDVALGEIDPQHVKGMVEKLREEEEEVDMEQLKKIEKQVEILQRDVHALYGKFEEFEREFTRQVERLSNLKAQEKIDGEVHDLYAKVTGFVDSTVKGMVAIEKRVSDVEQALGARVQTPVGAVDVAQEQVSLTIHKERGALELKQSDLMGRITIVYAEGLLPKGKAFTWKQLDTILEARFGSREFPGNYKKALEKLVYWGFFEKVQSGRRWDYRVKLDPEEAKRQGLLKEG